LDRHCCWICLNSQNSVSSSLQQSIPLTQIQEQLKYWMAFLTQIKFCLYPIIFKPLESSLQESSDWHFILLFLWSDHHFLKSWKIHHRSHRVPRVFLFSCRLVRAEDTLSKWAYSSSHSEHPSIFSWCIRVATEDYFEPWTKLLLCPN